MAGTTWGSSPYAEGAENKVEEASSECDLKCKQPNANGSCLSFPPPGGCCPLVPAPSLQAGSDCKASLGFLLSGSCRDSPTEISFPSEMVPGEQGRFHAGSCEQMGSGGYHRPPPALKGGGHFAHKMLLALAMCPCRKESRREKELGVCRAVRWRLWLEVCLHQAMLVPLVWPMKTWDLAFVPSMVLMFSASSVLLLHLLSFFSSSRVGDGEHAPEHPPSDRSHPSWAWGTPRPSLPVQAVVPSHAGPGRGHPSPARPSGGPSAGKRLTGRRQARRWLPAPDPALGWGAAGSCMLSARIAL